jgi:hypothetical protein
VELELKLKSFIVEDWKLKKRRPPMFMLVLSELEGVKKIPVSCWQIYKAIQT